ncbi:MAG TPA: extracellular solute-binding protein [Ruminiclostridium sp.]
MKGTWKRIISTVLVAGMVFTMAACGSSNTDSVQNTDSISSTAASASKVSNEKITLSLWAIFTENDPGSIAFFDAFNKVKAKHSNITFNYDAVLNEAYKTKIKTAAAANEMPDIFYTWGGGFAKPFIDAGKAVPIDQYVQDGTLDKLIPGSTHYYTYDNKLYGLPLDNWLCSLYVNKELFETNGIKVPTTFDELLTASKEFNAKGITPFALGAKDRWSPQFYQIALAIRTMGIDHIQNALDKKESFDQEGFTESAKLFKDLIDSKAFPDGTTGLSNDEVQAEFAAGKYPMMFSGNWMGYILDDKKNPIYGKTEILPFPQVTGGKGDSDGFIGGCITTFMISSTNKYQAESAEVLKTMGAEFSKSYYEMGLGLPSWNVDFDMTKISPATKRIHELTQSAKGLTLAWDTVLNAQPTQVYLDLVQGLIVGTITPEQFTKQLQAAQDADK